MVGDEREQRLGILYGLGAYAMWGVFPLYWPLMKPASAGEILAHRITWSLLVVGLLLLRRGGLGFVRELDRRRLALATAASLLIGINWMTYIWAVNSAHVVESALGYFINPIVTVLFGVLLLRERLRRSQWIAVGLSGAAVTLLTLNYGRPPWVALTLAFSFGLYGLVKKRAGLGALPSLAIETGVLAPLALLYLLFLHGGTFVSGGAAHAALLASAGIATTIPLLCFGAAANRIPLSILGLLQYVSPTLQFLCGVVVQHEPMEPSRWAGFALVWAGLLVFAADGFLEWRRARLAAPAQPVPSA
jgi:chloramphenicol-sensitive protein RarD